MPAPTCGRGRRRGDRHPRCTQIAGQRVGALVKRYAPPGEPRSQAWLSLRRRGRRARQSRDCPADRVAWFRVNFFRAACNVKHDDPPLGGDRRTAFPAPCLYWCDSGPRDRGAVLRFSGVNGWSTQLNACSSIRGSREPGLCKPCFRFRSAAECGYRRHGYSMTRYPALRPVRAGALCLAHRIASGCVASAAGLNPTPRAGRGGRDSLSGHTCACSDVRYISAHAAYLRKVS